MNQGAELYLDLMKRCLMNTIYSQYEFREFIPHRAYKKWLFRLLVLPQFRRSKARAVTPYNYDEDTRLNGRDWSPIAHTMIGKKRLDNLHNCIQRVLDQNVPGDFIETGVWRGGATIFMRAMLKAFGDTTRTVWVADSFEGLPRPNAADYPEDEGDIHHTHPELAVDLETVKENFRRYNLLDDQVRFLKGWFKDTLPTAPIERLAILRLDGDMYESTIQALTSLYDKVSPGGFVIVDDYGAVEGCRTAVHDFRKSRQIEDPITQIDWGGVFWQKRS